MAIDHRSALKNIKTFPQLIKYLRDELDWPIDQAGFDELTFDYTPEELGIDAKNAPKIEEIKRLRPLSAHQPWGIFFIKFAPKRLPVVALRRILGRVVLKKRASANKSEERAWAANDLLFISNYGEGDERQITFAHFSQPDRDDLPTLKVLGWDNLDTAFHLDHVVHELTTHLAWPRDESDVEAWRKQWREAFTLGHREVITTSKQLSLALAELARNIRDRIIKALEIETESGPLTTMMNAFRKALIHDLDTAGFADMYAQTIAYGLLSARIADPHKKTVDDFTAHLRTNPFLRELMEEFLHIGGRKRKAGGPGIDFDELGVVDVVELLDGANMEAVVGDFGDRNRQEDPVIHFYELFLSAYNKKLKVQRGVFYTPQPVVSYIVRSVHELLQSEFGLVDGLADTTTWGEMVKKHTGLKLPTLTDLPGEERTISPDEPFVQILDPATGTATFLVEVINVIHRTLAAKWKQQRLTQDQQHAVWNEYVPKHLLPRLHAYELMMAPYAIAHMKIGLKLAETGYRFGTDERARIYLTNALEPWVKQLPLIGFDALAHEAAEVNEIKRHKRFTVVIGNPPYSSSISEPEWLMRQLEDWKRGLNETKSDLNREEWKFLRLAQYHCTIAGPGIVGFIINRDFLDGIVKRRMRDHLNQSFPLRIAVDLNGDVKGNISDENVFEIEQGVAIAVLATKSAKASLRYVSRVGTRAQKYADLNAKHPIDVALTEVETPPPYFRWVPYLSEHSASAAAEYTEWPEIKKAFGRASSGIQTKRDSLCVAFTRAEMWERVQRFHTLTASEACAEFGLGEDGRDWTVKGAKADIAASGPDQRFLCPILYRPFDIRFTYWTGRTKGFLAYPRREVMQHVVGHKNLGMIFNRQIVGDSVSHFGVARIPICHGTFYLGNKGQDYFAPLLTFDDDSLATEDLGQNNFTPFVLDSLRKSLGSEAAELTPEDIFHYIYAVFHSPKYRSRYAEFLKIDFPRLPLTGNWELFRALVRLGGELTPLHLLESPRLGQSITKLIGALNPVVEEVSWSGDSVWLDKAQTTGFLGVPEHVWNFYVGGYQVCERWLRYRKGRPLSNDDIAHYHQIVVALSETIRLMGEIDEVIEQHGGWPKAFQTGAVGATAIATTGMPFRIVADPSAEQRYVTCVPLVPLKAAAGAFSAPQAISDDEWEWAEVRTAHRLRPGMFVAQIVGRSMEPAIADGSYCLFSSPVHGSRQGKTLLAKLHRDQDPNTGDNFTVKRYRSEKVADGDSWRHERIVLEPINREFQSLVFEESPDDSFAIVAELLEVLVGESTDGDDPEPTPGGRPTPPKPFIPSAPRTASFPTHGLFAPRKGNGSESGHDDPDSNEASAEDDAEHEGEAAAAPRRRFTDQFSVEDVLLHVRDVVCNSEPLPRDEAIREIARRLGAERTGSRIRDLIEDALRTASRRYIVETVSGGLVPATRTIDDYDREFLKVALKNAIGRAWTNEDEAIRAATRWLGFRRTGSKIEAAFRSAIRGALRQGTMERDRQWIRST